MGVTDLPLLLLLLLLLDRVGGVVVLVLLLLLADRAVGVVDADRVVDPVAEYILLVLMLPLLLLDRLPDLVVEESLVLVGWLGVDAPASAAAEAALDAAPAPAWDPLTCPVFRTSMLLLLVALPVLDSSSNTVARGPWTFLLIFVAAAAGRLRHGGAIVVA